jgi:glycosyltransferase involved in cell wall biosynthesis
VKIVHVAPFYAPVVGGVEEVVKRVAEYMASRGCEVFVVTYNRLRSSGVGALPRHEVMNGVRVIRVRPDFTWSYGTYSSELPEVVKGLRPDVVHVHVWRHPHAFQVARLKRIVNFRAIIHGHAPFYRFNQLDLITWAYHKIIDALRSSALQLYDKYVALTPYEAKRIKDLGLDYGKITVIPDGVEEDKCPTNDFLRDERQVLYLGRISRSKNLNLLIKAMVYVNKSVGNVKLVLAGPDEGLAMNLVRFAKKKGIKARYLGYVSEAEKHRLYMESSVYVLPSLYEGFGLTLIEAALHGVPSVITGEGGQLYAAPPNRTSLWARPNPRDYANAITALLSDKGLRERLAQQAKEWAREHVWNKILPRYEKLYEELEAKKP